MNGVQDGLDQSCVRNGDEGGIAEPTIRSAVQQGLAIKAAHAAARRRQHGLASGNVPRHCAAMADEDVSLALGKQAELDRR